MSNGMGQVICILLGLALIIIGVGVLVAWSWVESEEGLDLEINETTPEGKAQTYFRNFVLILGIGLIAVGIIVIIACTVKR